MQRSPAASQDVTTFSFEVPQLGGAPLGTFRLDARVHGIWLHFFTTEWDEH